MWWHSSTMASSNIAVSSAKSSRSRGSLAFATVATPVGHSPAHTGGTARDVVAVDRIGGTHQSVRTTSQATASESNDHERLRPSVWGAGSQPSGIVRRRITQEVTSTPGAEPETGLSFFSKNAYVLDKKRGSAAVSAADGLVVPGDSGDRTCDLFRVRVKTISAIPR